MSYRRQRIPKDYRPLLDACVEQGWRVRETAKCIMAYPTNGMRPIPFHSSPGRGCALSNQKAELRRSGLDLP